MNEKKYQLEYHKKYLLNRVTRTPTICSYIEVSLSSEDEGANHTFHKIMIHKWYNTPEELFTHLSKYFTSYFIPVNYMTSGDVTSFYTSNLSFVMNIIKFDFLFPFQSIMYNIDIIFNDKTSSDFFGKRLTIEDIVSEEVNNRMNGKFELDLSNFCNEPEFISKGIFFYDLSLLANFKILMLRIAKDTQVLNLSKNNISQVPTAIMNFFIRGDLIAINLSDNNISSVSDLIRVSSKIEYLWVEGNPLCDEMDALSYVKQILVKFPRLKQLDGIEVHRREMIIPFFQNFLVVPDMKNKMLIEKFLTLYFTHFDTKPRNLAEFYDAQAALTLNTGFTDMEESWMPHYAANSRNILHPMKRNYANKVNVHSNKTDIMKVFNEFPQTLHDPTTFTVDVPHNDNKMLVVIVSGVYTEVQPNRGNPVLQFRRTFVFNQYHMNNRTVYQICNEMFYVQNATVEMKDVSFKRKIVDRNSLALIEPGPEEIEAICRTFAHVTQLKKDEVIRSLKKHQWDIKLALKEFVDDLRANKVPLHRYAFAEEHYSDASSSSSSLSLDK